MNGLDRLVDGLFDYAGMFPPATLPLDQALRESARFHELHRPHLVGNDLVLDLKDLGRLTAERVQDAGYTRGRLGLCLVGIPAEQAAEAVRAASQLQAPLDLASVEVHGEDVPHDLVDAAAETTALLYFEPRWPEEAWDRRFADVLDALVTAAEDGAPIGLKFRGSGPYALSNATLRWLLPAVVEAGIPLKATQGLHHPVIDAQVGNTLGFLNLATGLRLLQVVTLGFADHLDALLGERDPKAFLLKGQVSWRGHRMDLEDLAAAQEELPFAIGSCSLQEPDDDLQRLWPAQPDAT